MGGIPHQHNYMYQSPNNGNSAIMGTTMVHLESISQRIFQQRGQMQQESRAPNGNYIGFTGRPLENINDRYINPKIEEELKDFKKEIEEKFAKSKLKAFQFPLKKKNNSKITKLPNPNMRSARYGDKNSETERSDGNNSSIGGSVDRRGNNQSQFISY